MGPCQSRMVFAQRWCVHSCEGMSAFVCQVSEQVNGSMTALQAEKERLMRSVSEKEAELSSLRQAAQVQQSSLQQEREKSSRELGELQGKLKDKVSSQSELSAKNSSVPKHQKSVSGI